MSALLLAISRMASPSYGRSANGTTDSPISSGSRGISDIFAIQLEVTGRLLEAEQNKVSYDILFIRNISEQ